MVTRVEGGLSGSLISTLVKGAAEIMDKAARTECEMRCAVQFVVVSRVKIAKAAGAKGSCDDMGCGVNKSVETVARSTQATAALCPFKLPVNARLSNNYIFFFFSS